ncbi:hypothetical protein [Hymenobacter chitinivorans]|uniref:Uncharacterized protein n=1 Tax=Hymenobacter chitinivorans DSM 11115 TaxID=1121954 RepID=A0A2M9BSR9_9BACT|nr:hypothetical protein [Hymenobacter chitinivorans]PJJ60942.1 hypothetical protein CLV45_2379 [Hymenobacter chitinivorans DSM 11115]
MKLAFLLFTTGLCYLGSHALLRAQTPAAPGAAPDSPAASAAHGAPATPAADRQRQPFQFSVVSPLGTNGLASGRTVNTVSLNLLAGYAAGVQGLELGTLLNVDRDAVQGVQAAGMVNLVGGPVRGTQLAGLGNLITADAHGLQAAGLLNVAVGPVEGAQLAGMVNYQGGAAETRTAQVAGLANVTPGNVRGVQVAGLLNVARSVRGLQLAPFNIADSVAGASIGILSLVRHGYHRAEVWASDALPANAALKLGGSRKFYNILAVGVQPGSSFRWGLGYGVGSEVELSRRLTLSVDALATQVNERKGWTDELNLLNQLRPLLGWRLTPGGRTTLLLGPTLNVMVSRYRDAEQPGYGSRLGGQHLELFNETHGRTNTRAWVGAQAGLRF